MEFIMKELTLAKGKVALVDDEDYVEVIKYKWWLDSDYVRGWVNGNQTRLHNFIMGENDGMEVDHINRNGLDNRRCNLRFVTRSQNSMNRDANKNGTSKYKGVRLLRQKYWTAQIKLKGKNIHLGNFKSELLAAEAYDKAAKKYFGEYARLNFPI
jgi:hypothetical protein